MTGRSPAGSPARVSIRDGSWRLCKGTPPASASECGSRGFRGAPAAGNGSLRPTTTAHRIDEIGRDSTRSHERVAVDRAQLGDPPTKNGPGDANRPGPTMGVTPITGSAGS